MEGALKGGASAAQAFVFSPAGGIQESCDVVPDHTAKGNQNVAVTGGALGNPSKMSGIADMKHRVVPTGFASR